MHGLGVHVLSKLGEWLQDVIMMITVLWWGGGSFRVVACQFFSRGRPLALWKLLAPLCFKYFLVTGVFIGVRPVISTL